MEPTNFTLRKFKNNPFKKLGLPLEFSYFMGGILLGKIVTNDNGSNLKVNIFPNIQMSYYLIMRLIKYEDYLHSWIDLLAVCKLDMPRSL